MKRFSPALVGIILAVATVFAVRALPALWGLELLAAILVAAGVVYMGAALSTGRKSVIRVEVVTGSGFVAAALIGLWFSPALLGAGYLAHAVWDYLHHPLKMGAKAGSWFPPFCLVYDIAVGGYILLMY